MTDQRNMFLAIVISMAILFGWDYFTSAILLVIATGIYTIAGGLAAVIYTDLFQAFIMIGGSVLITMIGLDQAGGFAGLREALPPEFFETTRSMP